MPACTPSVNGFANTPSLHVGAPLHAEPSERVMQAPGAGDAQQKGAQPVSES